MNKAIAQLEPQSLWTNFASLLNTPRPSKKEAKVIELVRTFGQNLGLETHVDAVGNVIIRKPATPGMENRQGVVLQAHLDMVPQKNSDKVHNFETDPIEAFVDGDWVKANGTTLGSDNGIGAAAIMAVLQSKDIQHPAIEGLFTIDEETGMTGAFALQPNLLTGKILLNLDSEDEGELYIGCAGGVDTTASMNFEWQPTPSGYTAYTVQVSGLKGGHSGLDIHLARANANKVLVRLLINANEHLGVLLAHIDGGNLRNAIPREASATVLVPEGEEETFLSFCTEIKEIYAQIASEDTGLRIQATPTEMPEKCIDLESLDNILNALHLGPNGVIARLKDMPDVVETSTNLATVKIKENTVIAGMLQRSSSEEGKEKVKAMTRNVFEKYGASVTHSGDYPGWQPNVQSPILQTMKNIYNQRFGKVPEVKVIHAGLECGILARPYPHWDMISFGPTIRFPHSPDEKVNIPSVQKFWDYLVATLENIPQ